MIMHLFMTPDAYRKDPGGYALNQALHLVIGFLLALIFSPVLILIVFAAWEYGQWRRWNAESFDCYEDLAFVTSGAAVAVLWSHWSLVPALLWLGSGILVRHNRLYCD